ncbi:MAG: glycoside hydrolase family 35 protein, partial [Mycobacteriales bacterium]
TVLLYQVENELGYNGDAEYMTDLQQQARKHGITVPITHNHCCGPNTWATGPGSVQLPGEDSYPQGFDCAEPKKWKPVRDLPRLRDDAPIFTPEFQGGSYDPWGGPGYDKCRQLTGPDFQKVFYKNNVVAGATMQNFYMLFGGTSWGWLPDPGLVYSSYDYGAAITENRGLTPKYDEVKRQGYAYAALKPLAKTDRSSPPPSSNPAIRIDARANPDTGARFLVVRHTDSTSTSDDVTTTTIEQDGVRDEVPLRLNGRDCDLLTVGYDLGGQRLVYSTSEIMTHAKIGGRDVAVLYGREGQAGRTVLKYAKQPTVRVLAGSAEAAWDGHAGVLRLNYAHTGLTRVLIEGGGRQPLLLLLGSDSEAAKFWQVDTHDGPVLVRGPRLVRTADVSGKTLRLTGDTDTAGDAEVFAPKNVHKVQWNDRSLRHTATSSKSHTVRLDGPRPVTLPKLTDWRQKSENPEARPEFDDSDWTVADKHSTNNPTKPPAGSPVLYADEYGFHHGDIWYRGRFAAKGAERAVSLDATTGKAGVYLAWLNGVYLGSAPGGKAEFAIPAGTLRAGADNVLSVLVENMGHNSDFKADDTHKEPRGLVTASVADAAQPISWRIQGNLGGQRLKDPVRGPFNS